MQHVREPSGRRGQVPGANPAKRFPTVSICEAAAYAAPCSAIELKHGASSYSRRDRNIPCKQYTSRTLDSNAMRGRCFTELSPLLDCRICIRLSSLDCVAADSFTISNRDLHGIEHNASTRPIAGDKPKR